MSQQESKTSIGGGLGGLALGAGLAYGIGGFEPGAELPLGGFSLNGMLVSIAMTFLSSWLGSKFGPDVGGKIVEVLRGLLGNKIPSASMPALQTDDMPDAPTSSRHAHRSLSYLRRLLFDDEEAQALLDQLTVKASRKTDRDSEQSVATGG